MCDDIVIVDKGRVVASGDAATLRRERGGRKYKITVSAPLADVEAALSATPGVEGLERRGGGTVVVSVAENLDDQALLAAAQRSGPVREFAPVEATLAEIFRGTVTK